MSKYVPQPIIQIDFPAPHTPETHEKDNNMSAQVRALQWFALMKVTANEVGPDKADEFSTRMTVKMVAMPTEELEQLVRDFDVLVPAIRAASGAVQAGLMLHRLRDMGGRITDIIDEGQGEDPLDDGDEFLPKIPD
jgi:hypothetical protein